MKSAPPSDDAGVIHPNFQPGPFPTRVQRVTSAARCQHLYFAGETGEAIGIGGEGVGEDFDAVIAVELGVSGAVDNAHAASAELGGDAVMRDKLLWLAGRDFRNSITSTRIPGESRYSKITLKVWRSLDVRWRYRRMTAPLLSRAGRCHVS